MATPVTAQDILNALTVASNNLNIVQANLAHIITQPQAQQILDATNTVVQQSQNLVTLTS